MGCKRLQDYYPQLAMRAASPKGIIFIQYLYNKLWQLNLILPQYGSFAVQAGRGTACGGGSDSSETLVTFLSNMCWLFVSNNYSVTR